MVRPLPTLATLSMMALLFAACSEEAPPPPPQASEKVPNVYLEALQNAEAARFEVEKRNLEEQRINALLGREAPQPAR
ncbi:MAG: hypothetical protein KDJ27_14395 [Gammaproteobacteria bacterium]|nr:hypothetical protein [Gammaproteobacteria bacterium]MCB1924908.1 hypothetical protein [Gammaproteobacteria bacterium]